MEVWWRTTLPRILQEDLKTVIEKVKGSKDAVHDMIECIHDEALLERSYYLRKKLRDVRQETRNQSFEISVKSVNDNAVANEWHSSGWGSHGVRDTGRDWDSHSYIRSGRPSFGKSAPAGGGGVRGRAAN